MLFALHIKRFCLVFISSLFSYLSTSLVPIKAATFTSLAQYNIELDSFNQSPINISARGDGDTTIIANDGFLSNFIDTNAEFLATTNRISAYSNSTTILSGTTNDYLGNLQFSSSLIGSFSIQAQESLQFSVNGFLNLLNRTDDLATSNLSSLVKMNLFLRDRTTQNRINILQVFGNINTNSNLELSQDFYKFQTGSDLRLNNYSQLISLDEMNEIIQTSFAGFFQKQFMRDTQLDLMIVTESCNYTSNQLDTCKKIPEPSNKFILIDLLIVVIYMRLFVRTMK